MLKFIYSEKAKKFCEIFTLLLSYVVPVKSKVKISQNSVAFSEYMNFIGITVICRDIKLTVFLQVFDKKMFRIIHYLTNFFRCPRHSMISKTTSWKTRPQTDYFWDLLEMTNRIHTGKKPRATSCEQSVY